MQEIEWKGKKLPIPPDTYIGSGERTEKLYALEKKRSSIIIEAAREQGELFDHDKKDFWTHSAPAQLADVLGSFEPGVSIPAAIAYLQRQGFTVQLLQEQKSLQTEEDRP